MPLGYAVRRPASTEAVRLAQTLLEGVGLADRINHEPSKMSGGRQQRVSIGRALVIRPALVLADEPTGNLDSHTSVEIVEMFRQLNTEGITVVLVTHDPKVATYADRVINIVDGQIDGDGAPALTRGKRMEVAFGEQFSTSEVPYAKTTSASVPARASLFGDPSPMPSRWGKPILVPHMFWTAIEALQRNKMRSALSAIGVIIAVGAVIAMAESGKGSKAA
jgi:macrolide transport system ATP-binding/permease protein